jgi:glycosyltransferase involved in cell wall biosynthesis
MISEHASPLAALGGIDSGGQNVYVASLARLLARRGLEVDVYTRRDAPCLPEWVQCQPGLRVIHVPAGPPAAIPKEDLLPQMPEFADFMRASCRARRYDLVHANFWMSGMVAAELQRRLGIPFVVTFHALGRVRRLWQGTDDRFPDARFSIEEEVTRSADRIIAECPQDRADLMELYDADPERLRVIPCGFDPNEMFPVPRSTARAVLGLPQDAFVVLQLGRLVPRKGIETVVRGFARFCRGRGGDARLLVVGGESSEPDPHLTPEIGRLRRIAQEEGVAGRVFFTGQRGRGVLRYYYSAADVFVTLPWYEPFGITPLEAMACAVPVIGSTVGGVKYTVVDGLTGCLVPPSDAEALAECLRTLGRDAALRDAMGQRGRLRVARHFTWARVAVQVEAAYEDLLGRRRRGNGAVHPKGIWRNHARRAAGGSGAGGD